MDALTRWCLYILTAYLFVVLVAVAAGVLVGWLTRGVWRRTRTLIDRALDDDPYGEDDGDLTALLDAIREDPDDGPTQELRPHPVYVGRRRRREHHLSDSYINVTTWCFLAAAALLAVCLLAIIALDIRRDRPDGRHRPEHARGTDTQVLRDDTMPIDRADIPEVVW